MEIYHNANIYAPGIKPAEALAVDRERILAIGSDAEILDSFSGADSIVNLDGRTIWPGLTDAHVHLQHLAESRTMVDCETKTLDECLRRVESAARTLPENAWVRGHGWNQNLWKEGFGSAAHLDQVCGGRPAYLTAKSLHAAWANTKALELAGINARTPDPPGGILQRDEQGQPTGILFENEAMALVESVITKPTLNELRAMIKALIPDLHRMGLIGVHDFDGLDCWEVLQSLHQVKALKLRVRKSIPFDHLDTFIETGFRTDHGDDWLNIGNLKLFSDGALGPKTGAMLAPYENSEELGTLLLTESEIVKIGLHAVNHGIALAIHAIGDRANRVVLDAFGKIRRYEEEHHLPHFQHRIEHVQVISPEDLPRLAELGIIASVQPVHAPSDMAMADRYLGLRSRYAYAYRTLKASGATLVFGSDAPVEPVNPFQGLHAAVTRQNLDGAPGDDGWHPEERLSLTEAIEGFSISPARISNRGGHLGRLTPGYLADFILLDRDPFAMEPMELASIKPKATFIAGKCVYQDPALSVDLKP